jgi:hypothetical protein
MGGSRVASEDHCVAQSRPISGENSGDLIQGPELTLGSYLIALFMTGLRILCGVKGRLEQDSWPPPSDSRLHWFLLTEDDMRRFLRL